MHGVVCWSQTVLVFVPWRRAGKEELDNDSSQIHVAKSSCKYWRGTRRSEEEHESRADERSSKVGDSIRQPGKDIQSDGLVGGKDVAQVCAVQDVLKSREHANPDWRSVFTRDKSLWSVSRRSEMYPMWLPKQTGRGATYWQPKKKTSQAAMGRKGRKNCLVMGKSKDSIRRVATVVLTSGPGD